MWSWPVIAETEPLVKWRRNQRGSVRGLEKPSHFIEDPLPFKNFDEGALHLKRFASRCTNGAGGRSLEIEVLLARGRLGRGVLLPGQRYRGHSFFLSNEALDWNNPGVLVRLQGWAMVEVGYAGRADAS